MCAYNYTEYAARLIIAYTQVIIKGGLKGFIYSVLFYWKDLFFAHSRTNAPVLALLVRKAMKAAYFVKKEGFKTLSIFKLSYSATNFQRLQRTP